jgi:hypothetical protein
MMGGILMGGTIAMVIIGVVKAVLSPEKEGCDAENTG